MKIPKTMTAVLLTGHGGFEKLELRDDTPVPNPGPDDVLIKVAAAGINNTDINTRIGWYAKSVTGETNAGGTSGFDELGDNELGSWGGAGINFPLIQGGDCCGYIAGVGKNVDASRIGDRVLVRNILKSPLNYAYMDYWVYGSECNGAFAQYTVAPSCETDAVVCNWSDAELGAIPITYSTAECMLDRAGVGAERVLITGASGGVGTAAIQLAKRRGAEIVGVSAKSKEKEVLEAGADKAIDRNSDLVEVLGEDSVDVVVDVVAGPMWPALPRILVRGGRYVAAGAVAGPIVEFDVRDLYLKDLSFFGCCYKEDAVSENLVRYIEANEFRPLVSRTYPLSEIVQAQQDFLSKQFIGKLVLIPPQD